jgi:hypothetical protein
MDNNFAELLTTAGWNTPKQILEGQLILSVVKVLFTGCTPSLHPHCTHKVENAKGKGCTCTRCTCGSGIPDSNLQQVHFIKVTSVVKLISMYYAIYNFIYIVLY